MNYQAHYNALIAKRQLNPHPKDIYTERHHIVPRAHGGGNDNNNIVRLSGREHFLAHWLLWKIHRDYVMTYAFAMMRNRLGQHINSRTYSMLKADRSRFNSGKGNPMYGKPARNKGIPSPRRGIPNINARGKHCGDKHHMRNPEIAEKSAAARRGRVKRPDMVIMRSKSIVVNGVVYKKATDAIETLNVSHVTLFKWLAGKGHPHPSRGIYECRYF